MTAWIVTESLFGNTLSIAQAIGAGIAEVRGRAHVRVLHASEAPPDLPGEVDLLVIGAPTHTLSMPNASTRHDAVLRLGAPAGEPAGVREWLANVAIPDGLRVATFDTSIHHRIQLGTASRAAARTLHRRGVPTTVGPSFWVTGMEGPLADGELPRATAWGRQLAGRAVGAAG
jgi:hypothetical protein